MAGTSRMASRSSRFTRGIPHSWVDYSHGIRLVSRRLLVNGEATTIDRRSSPIPNSRRSLSNEGVMLQTRYDSEQISFRAITGRAGLGKLDDDASGSTRRAGRDRSARRPHRQARLLIFYALPNGNTIEQTIGKAIKPGDDWHFDIQHIGAQLAFLAGEDHDRQLVVAYLENNLKSWPVLAEDAWGRGHFRDHRRRAEPPAGGSHRALCSVATAGAAA